MTELGSLAVDGNEEDVDGSIASVMARERKQCELREQERGGREREVRVADLWEMNNEKDGEEKRLRSSEIDRMEA